MAPKPKPKAPKPKASQAKTRTENPPRDAPEETPSAAPKAKSTARGKNKKKPPNPHKWPLALRKSLFEKKGLQKRERGKLDINRKAWWDDKKRLNLFMHIVKYRKISLSEFEWRDIADVFGRTWNGIRLEFSQVMGNYFPDHKRGSKKLLAAAASKAAEASAQSSSQQPSASQNQPTVVKIKGRRWVTEIDLRVRPAYRFWSPSAKTRKWGFV